MYRGSYQVRYLVNGNLVVAEVPGLISSHGNTHNVFTPRPRLPRAVLSPRKANREPAMQVGGVHQEQEKQYHQDAREGRGVNA
jgi:hypothetical protein